MLQGNILEGDLQAASGWGSVRGCDAVVACEVVEHMHHPDGLAVAILGAIRHVQPFGECAKHGMTTYMLP